jgi:acyl-CoA thioesterase-1
LELLMNPELVKMYTLLLGLLGTPQTGEPDLNMPAELILKRGDQIIAIGDSITEAGGYLKYVDAVLAHSYPDLKLPPIKNVGASGQKAEDLIKRFQKDVVDQKPAVVTISIGINDVWHRANIPHQPQVLADYWTNVAKMVEMAQKAGIRVILLTPTVIEEDPSAAANKRLRIYIEAEKQVARERKCTLVDLHRMFMTAVLKHPADVVDKAHWLTFDGVHMHPAGNAMMSIGLLRALGVPDSKLLTGVGGAR